MAAVEGTGGHPTGMFKTLRTDAWWFEPLWTGLGFLIFTIYANYEMFKGDHYWWSNGQTGFGGYLSPFFSPLLFIEPGLWPEGMAPHAFFGNQPGWWPTWFPSISAALILPLPLSFRLTCYYYRKFYYRAYFMSPPACAVNPVPQPGKYEGERMLLLFQNLHRYALYAAIVVLGFLAHDAYMSFFRGGHFGVGVGSIILTLNPILLGMYTFGCHAWRHLIGGRKDCFSCDAINRDRGMTRSYGLWRGVTWLNERHMLLAWVSMIWVGWTAVYVRLVATGTIHDYSTWGN